MEGKTEFEEAVKKMQRKKEAGGKEEGVQGFLDEVVKGDGDGGDGKKKQMARPFGVALLIAGHDDLKGSQLYFSDPSGTFVRYKAKAIGAGSEGAQTSLAESYSESMTMEEAENLALGTLKQIMEEKIDLENVELARVTEKGYVVASKEEVATVLARL